MANQNAAVRQATISIRFRLGNGLTVSRRAKFDSRFIGIEREKIVSRAVQREAANLQRFAMNRPVSLVTFEVA
jgi:hypothetical protein